MISEARNILKKYWGHESFRSLQEEIITASVEEGKDVVALMPTGGGKSLCFQIPGLMQEGICIVISPLIALMQDQVNFLKEKGIKAIALTGGISYSDLDAMLDNCIYGNYKFLYLSPERLQQDLVKQRIKQMNVNLIAIDEAHCISQWGHDFRPSYLNIAQIKELQPQVPMMALTATATKTVLEDIIKQLDLKQPSIFQKSFERKNIAYRVVSAHDKNYYLLEMLRLHEGSAIVYVRSRNATTEISNFLNQNKITSAAFHGGLSNSEKEHKLKQWILEEKRVMVATNAFGMGIDKSNVRCIIHYNLPESLESYFQEAGRAGRDEKEAAAIIITNASDIPRLKNQFLSSLPSKDYIQLIYKKLNSYFRIAYGEGEGEKFNFNFADFCKVYNLKPNITYNALTVLERFGIIALSQEFYKKLSLQFLIPSKELLFYLEKNLTMDLLVKTILRSYGGIYENKTEIDLDKISEKVNLKISETIKLLLRMQAEKIIDLDYNEHDISINFLVPREDDHTINPFLRLISMQNKSKEAKIESVLQYIGNEETCKSEQLLHYFGEDKTQACGICSVCTKLNEKLPVEQIKNIYSAIIKQLETGSYSSRELVRDLGFSENHVLETIKLLLERKIITVTPIQKYKLIHL
ncbi:MAG TPA: RecQ family ATP-dependent DNA helicase [Salinimicrobium sp.]|nr:RecQ family ATP-dependent DNA helicase [Salinimicrobium sp.]